MRRRKASIVVAMMAGVMASCTVPPTTAPSSVAGSLDPSCRVVAASRPWNAAIGVAVTMMTRKDADWCAISFIRLDFDIHRSVPAGAVHVTSDPGHGTVRSRDAKGQTLIEYKPAPGYAGSDKFAFRLDPGNGYYPVKITVGE